MNDACQVYLVYSTLKSVVSTVEIFQLFIMCKKPTTKFKKKTTP